MKLLIDAHTLLWAVDDLGKLSNAATTALQDPANILMIGAGTIWEIGIKTGLGKLTLSIPFRQWMDRAMVSGCRRGMTTDTDFPIFLFR
jgi:PIN domain nuclease of toxin-antitoxin system